MAGQENRPGQSDGSGPKDIPSADELRQHLSDAIDEAEESLELFTEDLDNDLLSDVTNRSELRKAREREVDPSLKKARILIRRYKSLVDESQSKQFEDQIANLITKIGNLNNRFPSEETGPDRIEPIRKLKEKIAEYSKALQDARDSGKHFDPRDDFNKEGIPLLNLALLKKKAVVWIPEKGADVAKLEEREQIIAEISKADDLVSEWMKEIAAVDVARLAAWTIPIVPADIAEIDSFKGESETVLAAQTDVNLNTSLTNLGALKKRIEKLLQDEPRKINPIILDAIQVEYPGMDLDPLYTEQKKKYDVPLTQIKVETERRKAHLNTFTETQQRLAAEQAKQLIIDQWRVATQPFAEAIDKVLNPVRPLGELYNKDWIVLKNAIEKAKEQVENSLLKPLTDPLVHPLIDEINVKYEQALRKLPIIIDVEPRDPWNTFAYQQNFITRGEDPAEEKNIKIIEKGILNWALGYITSEIWDNPNDSTKEGEITFDFYPIRKDSSPIKLKDVLYKHPDAHRQKEMREQFEILTDILKGGISWAKITAVPNHTKIEEHLTHYMFNGGTFHQLIHLPELADKNNRDPNEVIIEPGYDEPGFGEVMFEGMSWYSRWNKEFIYATPDDMREIASRLNSDITVGNIRIPTEIELRRVFASLTEDHDAPLNLVIGRDKENPLTPKAVLRLFFGEANQDYAQFKDIYKRDIQKARITKLESDRQIAFGIHPLREIGEEIRSLGGTGTGAGATAERALNIKRKELAIALGCYRIGLGDYIPDLKSLSRIQPANKDGGQLVEQVSRVKRPLTELEKERAFKAGQSAELFAFTGYECNGNQITDDNVTAKSAVTAGRLTQTEQYRTNYGEVGREGLNIESVKIFKQLFPSPWLYMGLDGVSLKKLIGDREKRKHAKYNNLGNSESGPKRKLLEAYGFAVKIYDALAYGTQNVEPNVSFLDLSTIERPGGVFSREETLVPKDEKIQKLGTYVDKIIGYYLDRMYVQTTDVTASGSIYPPVFWREIPGTKYSSPIPELMVNLPQDALNKLAKETNRVGFKKAWIKVYLSAMILESLMRSHVEEINLADKVTLKYVLAGQRPKPYTLGGKGKDPKESLNVPNFSDMFGYSPEEVEDIVRAANLKMKNEWTIFMQQLGGI